MPDEADLTGVDLNLLVLFEALMRERHAGRTGERLHLSPSAVSHGLARLRGTLNDPLFLKHPKGMVPTARAEELALPIADILQRIRGVVRSSDGFDPKRSNRRFTIGAPDAVLLEVVPPLLTRLAERAPGVDLHLRTTLPQSALADLDARHADLMLQPLDDVPPRFLATPLYEEEFAIAMRAGHPVAARLTLARYCAASHVLVSTTGDPHGRVDIELKKLGRSRRIAATVPNFLLALSLVAQSDLLAAVPSRTAADARRFGAVLHEPPSPLAPLGRSSIQLIVPHAAMTDAGVAWLARTVTESARLPPRRRR